MNLMSPGGTCLTLLKNCQTRSSRFPLTSKRPSAATGTTCTNTILKCGTDPSGRTDSLVMQCRRTVCPADHSATTALQEQVIAGITAPGASTGRKASRQTKMTQSGTENPGNAKCRLHQGNEHAR